MPVCWNISEKICQFDNSVKKFSRTLATETIFLLITLLFWDNGRPFAVIQMIKTNFQNQNKKNFCQKEASNFSWTPNLKVEFQKCEDLGASFCLAFILTSCLILKILVSSFQLIDLYSKTPIHFFPISQSPRLRD